MATLLLKKSYLHKNLKEIKFHDLWNFYGAFTTMRVIGRPAKILFFDEHINNLLNSLKIYNIKNKNQKKNILKLISIHLKKNKNYDHLLRIAINKKIISISLRKRVKIDKKFKLKLINYQRVDPKHKNLKYKKIVRLLNSLDTSKFDIALHKNNQILETGTSNILFFKGKKVFSPNLNIYKGTTLKFFAKKLKKIFNKRIYLDSLDNYDEILLIGSGKAVTSVESIENTTWKRKSLENYRLLNNIYQKAVKNCPRYKS